MSDKDIDELNKLAMESLSEITGKAVKAESAIGLIMICAEECSKNGGNQFFCDDVLDILNQRGYE